MRKIFSLVKFIMTILIIFCTVLSYANEDDYTLEPKFDDTEATFEIVNDQIIVSVSLNSAQTVGSFVIVSGHQDGWDPNLIVHLHSSLLEFFSIETEEYYLQFEMNSTDRSEYKITLHDKSSNDKMDIESSSPFYTKILKQGCRENSYFIISVPEIILESNFDEVQFYFIEAYTY